MNLSDAEALRLMNANPAALGAGVPPLLSFEQAAGILRISPTTVENLTRAGHITGATQTANGIFIQGAAIQRFLRTFQQDAGEEVLAKAEKAMEQAAAAVQAAQDDLDAVQRQRKICEQELIAAQAELAAVQHEFNKINGAAATAAARRKTAQQAKTAAATTLASVQQRRRAAALHRESEQASARSELEAAQTRAAAAGLA